MALKECQHGTLFTGANGTTDNVKRFGDKSLGNIVRTDERYGHDGLFLGPRGLDYSNYLENSKPIQTPNLWSDMQSTSIFLTSLPCLPAAP